MEILTLRPSSCSRVRARCAELQLRVRAKGNLGLPRATISSLQHSRFSTSAKH